MNNLGKSSLNSFNNRFKLNISARRPKKIVVPAFNATVNSCTSIFDATVNKCPNTSITVLLTPQEYVKAKLAQFLR